MSFKIVFENARKSTSKGPGPGFEMAFYQRAKFGKTNKINLDQEPPLFSWHTRPGKLMLKAPSLILSVLHISVALFRYQSYSVSNLKNEVCHFGALTYVQKLSSTSRSPIFVKYLRNWKIKIFGAYFIFELFDLFVRTFFRTFLELF